MYHNITKYIKQNNMKKSEALFLAKTKGAIIFNTFNANVLLEINDSGLVFSNLSTERLIDVTPSLYTYSVPVDGWDGYTMTPPPVDTYQYLDLDQEQGEPSNEELNEAEGVEFCSFMAAVEANTKEDKEYSHKGRYYEVIDKKDDLYGQTLKAVSVVSDQGVIVGVCLYSEEKYMEISFRFNQLKEVKRKLTKEQKEFYWNAYHEGYKQAQRELNHIVNP